MTVMLFFTRVFLCTGLFFTFTCYAKEASPLLIKICVADHNKAPMFIDAKNEIPIINSQAQINTLKELDLAIDEVQFQYQQMPWQECISSIKHGTVDAFISGFNALKSDYAVFPVNKQGKPLDKYSFASLSQCLIGKRRFHSKWNSREVFQSKAFSLAVANGHFVGDAASEDAFFIEHTFTLQTAIERVAQGNADAALVICEISKNKVDLSQYYQFKLAPLFPPINTSIAYLAFSNEFFYKHKLDANLVWEQLASKKLAGVYARMLQNMSSVQNTHYGTKE